MQVLVSLVAGVLVLVLNQSTSSAASSGTLNCYANSSSAITTACTVLYTSSLTLHCPHIATDDSSPTGEWWRQNSVTRELNSVCRSANCTIGAPLHNEDSDLYFCEMNGGQKYYVNVTVLAPPSIVCDPYYCKCNQLTNTCLEPMISKEFSEDVQITAKFRGQGEMGVVWKHDGEVLNCTGSSESSGGIECNITSGRTSTYDYQILALPPPHRNVSRDSGMYIANISNPYGYNMTKEFVQITCPNIEPPKSTVNNTIYLANGETKTVTLSSLGSRQFYLWLCYTTDPSIDMWNIDLNDSCVKCNNEMRGSCPRLPNRPEWKVARNETGCCFGSSSLEVSVKVVDFTERDSGRMMLAWATDASDQGPTKHRVLTVTTLTYNETDPHTSRDGEKNRFVYVGIGSGGVCLVLVVSVVTVVSGVVVHKRRKAAARRQRRRAERRYEARNGGGGVRVRGAVTTTTEVSDNDGDQQCLVRGGENGDYGAIARHGCINNDTSEIENGVVLPSQSDDNIGVV